MTCDHRYVTPGCPNCENELADAMKGEGPSYTDDVIAVMRETITVQREAIAHLEACNGQLRIAETELRRELANMRHRVVEARNFMREDLPSAAEAMLDLNEVAT